MLWYIFVSTDVCLSVFARVTHVRMNDWAISFWIIQQKCSSFYVTSQMDVVTNIAFGYRSVCIQRKINAICTTYRTLSFLFLALTLVMSNWWCVYLLVCLVDNYDECKPFSIILFLSKHLLATLANIGLWMWNNNTNFM